MHRYLIATALLFILSCSVCIAQRISQEQWNKLESQINEKLFLQDNQKLLQQWSDDAKRNGNDIDYARAQHYLLKIRDHHTEDSLYFQNSAFIDTVLANSRSSAKLKAMMHIMQAQRLSSFASRYKKFSIRTYRTPKLKTNYADLSSEQIDSLVSSHLEQALSAPNFAYRYTDYKWLSSNSSILLFEPTFKDIVLSEQVNLVSGIAHYRGGNYADTTKQLLSLSSTEFRKRISNWGTLKTPGAAIIQAYANWIAYNQANAGKAAFIESLARKEIWLRSSQDDVLRKAYVDYLEASAKATYPELKAHAVYQLCLLYHEQGRNYGSNPNGRYYSFIAPEFDVKYKGFLLKAAQLYEGNRAFMKQFSQFDEILKLMYGQIKSNGLTIRLNQIHMLPGSPILLKATYRNTDTVYCRVVQISAAEDHGNNSNLMLANYWNSKTVATQKFVMPVSADYNVHATYLKLNGLPKGHYRLLFSYKPLTYADALVVNHIGFEVGNIAAVNSDERLFVLDRKTGTPINGATVKAYAKDKNNNDSLLAGPVKPVNKMGYTAIPSFTSKIVVSYNGDTTTTTASVHRDNLSDDVYEPDEDTDDADEDLLDYLDQDLQANIFTDRAIYRPGQTVHYKILLLTKNPETGAPMSFCADNIKNGKRLIKRWLDENTDPIRLKDDNYKVIDTAKLIINEYGSFAGSFVIPKNAATGDWKIDPGSISTRNSNRGSFKVEEYKRPTLELVMEKPKKNIRPGQMFSIQLKLRSFSGALMNGVPVQYTVTRRGKVPQDGDVREEIADTTGYTDAAGNLIVTINDKLLKRNHFADSLAWQYSYRIEAKATDPTGETVTVNDEVQALSRPVKISIGISGIYDKRKLSPFAVKTSANYEGTVGRDVKIRLYRTSDPELQSYSSDARMVDSWLYPRSDIKQWFPFLEIDSALAPQKELVYETTINTTKFENLDLNLKQVTAGFYEISATTIDSGRISGSSTYNFEVFDSETKQVATHKKDLSYLERNSFKPGEKITWYTSAPVNTYSVYQVTYVANGKEREIKNSYIVQNEVAGLRQWIYQIPKNATTDKLLLTRIYVTNNQIHREEQTIHLQQPEKIKPDIIIEKYRKIMAPGATETFSVSVKTKNDKVAAELLTTMYDASLDKLERREWDTYNIFDSSWQNLSTSWPGLLSYGAEAGSYESRAVMLNRALAGLPSMEMEPGQKLFGLAAGVSITQSSGLQEVVVTSYSEVTKHNLSASSVVRIRGTNSIADFKQPLIILNGTIYAGNLKDIAATSISEAMVLKGAEASAIYGSRAAEGVLIISTQGPIVLPEPEKPVAKVRKNFNETAFFFPQVHAGADGYYTFTFTMPESATEWNWRMLAHTKDARFAYLERKLQTQLNLMVQPNMPRLLYQGDHIKLQSRISNLSEDAAEGTVTCKIEDAVTGQDITALLTKAGSQPFKLNGKSSGAAGFMLQVPAGQQNPLKIIISIQSKTAADAEEHIIPVSSTRVFVRQSVPLHFGNQAQLTVPAVKMPAGSLLYGMGLSINPKPQAALINALPWLSNYSYNCAEQTFNKLKANVTALLLMRADTTAQNAYNRAIAVAATATQNTATNSLPDELAEQTMPWLNLGNQTAKHQQQLLKLLDTAKNHETIKTRMQRLYDLQQADGGLAWFDGGRSDDYISAYVLAGIRGLQKQGWSKLPFASEQGVFVNFMDKLSKFNLDQILKINLTNAASPLTQYMLYAAGGMQDKTNKGRAIAIIDAAWKSTISSSLDADALLIINTLNHTQPASPLYKKAIQLLSNIRQQAIVDEQNGMRWKDIADADELSSSAEETLALLAEAFALADKNSTTQSGMVKWLLTARQDEHWQTTKGTSAAINLLQDQKGGAFGSSQGIEVSVAPNEKLQVSNGLLSGNPAAFVKTEQLPATVTVNEQGTDVHGALSWYYFAEPAGLDTLNKGLSISRKLWYQAQDKSWQPVTATTRLKPGDKVRVDLNIEAGTRLKYVYINDPRAATFEPQGLQSEYHYSYSGGLAYYQSVRDVGMHFFASLLPRGTSTISYELTVVHEGEFAAAPATVQCMYKPNVTAYSSAVKVVTGAN